jgi:hypothetical protein
LIYFEGTSTGELPEALHVLLRQDAKGFSTGVAV